jgi:thiol-disulfide isomerase/thioredoxin
MEVKMKCPQCNNEAPDTNYHCPHCGNVLKPDLDPSDFHKKTVRRPASNTNILVLAIVIVGLAVLFYAAFFRKTGSIDSRQEVSPDVNQQQTSRFEPERDDSQPGNQTQQQPVQPDKVFEDPFFKDTEEEKKDDIKPKNSLPEISTPKTSTPADARVKGIEFSPGVVINSANPGEEINIEYYVQKGKTTIFDFYSDYCGPCRKISPLLERLDKKRDDIVVLRVDINRPGMSGIDWRSPLISQYRIKFVPFFLIYDPSGHRTHEGKEASYEVGKLLSSEGIR